ncbi:MAG TPA: AarF/UbiB family protein [Spirochaetia bacterium]|nr:AarF/UbiB family protein [Spirochaetia bacterium]
MFRSRYRRILWFFGHVIVGVAWWDILLPKIGFRGLSLRTRTRRMRSAAISFRALAIRMGGVLIKVGQFLSSRVDVLPREVTAELSGLQDEVGAESYEDIRRVVESEFGVSVAEKFYFFDPAPIASASIGQVHRARLCEESADGSPCPSVVVKVQRPRIREIVDADLAAIRVVGNWISHYRTISRHVNVPRLIEEFSRTLYEEMDYLQEGKNSQRFAENFAKQADVLVPQIIWSHSSARVLTLQDVGAIKISDYAAIEAAGIRREEVADKLVGTYLKQIFSDGFFHADPHPGNLFVYPEPTAKDPAAWRLAFVDFGMTGTLNKRSFASLQNILIAVGTRDATRLVDGFKSLNLLLPSADPQEIERATRRVFDGIWGKSSREINNLSMDDLREFTDEFGELLYQMPFQVPEDLILLGRCVSILSGMSTGLNPDFNIWNSIVPYAQKLIAADDASENPLLRDLFGTAGALASLPKRVETFLNRVEEGKIESRNPELRQQLVRLERSTRKIPASVVFAGVLMSGTALYLTGHTDLSIGFGTFDLVLLLWLIFSR